MICEPQNSSATRDGVLKLAERAVGNFQLMEILDQHAIVSLGLLDDQSASEKFAIRGKCTMMPADLGAYMQGLMSGRKEENPLSHLNVNSLEKVSYDSLSPEHPILRTRADMLAKADELGVKGRPLVMFYFTSKSAGTGAGVLAPRSVNAEHPHDTTKRRCTGSSDRR
jgi:hypothetical protein